MVSKTNKELLTDMSMACSDMYQAKLHFTPPEATGCQEEIDKAVKKFKDTVKASYDIAFAEGRLGDLLDDVALWLKNPNSWDSREQQEDIMKELQEIQKQHLDDLKNMPSTESH
jgi:hypothetical protein